MKWIIAILFLMVVSECFAARPRYTKPRNADETWQNDLDLNAIIKKNQNRATLAEAGISTTTGLNTDTPHTKDWPTQVWCLGPQFTICVDTAPLPYGQRVMISSPTSLIHGGFLVYYSLNKPSIILDNPNSSFGTAIQGRGFSNTQTNGWLVGHKGVWDSNTDSTVIFATYGDAIEFNTHNSDSPRMQVNQSSVTVYVPFQAKGSTTGITISAGNQGEIISTQTLANRNVGATDSYFDIVSTGISAGHWLISANATYAANGGTFTKADFELGISQTSGNSSTGLTVGDNYNYFVDSTILGTAGAFPVAVVNWELNITAPTTIYLKGFCGTYTGQPQVRGRMTAVRLP